ncbi:MAG: PHB depolymerase family esterase [Planctomycetota bacterium]
MFRTPQIALASALVALAFFSSCSHAPKAVATSSVVGAPLHGFEGRVLRWEPTTAGARAEVPYRLRRPTAGGAAPLLVFLHGAGERGLENERQLIHFGARLDGAALEALDGSYALCPQCPEGQRWVEASWNELPPAAMTEDPSAAMAEVLALVRHTLRTEPGIDGSRVYLTGLSMGAQGSWELAARRPDWFAALAPVCGGADPGSVAALAGVPVWAWHGVDDRTVPIERSELMVDALRDAGGAPRFEVLPEGTGHRAWDAAYAADSPLWAWMFEQRRR